MSVAIILPARLASTRLPNKLLLDRTGKTVLEHTIERAKEAQRAYPDLFTTLRVACDDERLLNAAKRAGVDAVMTRLDHQSGTDRIAEACAGLKEDIIVNLQADEPEINPDYMRMVSWGLTRSENEIPGVSRVQMATLATFIFDESTFKNPNVVKVVVGVNNKALYFSRAPIPFPRDGDKAVRRVWRGNDGIERPYYGHHHIGMYAYRRDFLFQYVKMPVSLNEQTERLEQLRALDNGHEIHVSFVASHVPGIDTPQDYEAFVQRCNASKNQEPGAQS